MNIEKTKSYIKTVYQMESRGEHLLWKDKHDRLYGILTPRIPECNEALEAYGDALMLFGRLSYFLVWIRFGDKTHRRPVITNSEFNKNLIGESNELPQPMTPIEVTSAKTGSLSQRIHLEEYLDTKRGNRNKRVFIAVAKFI